MKKTIAACLILFFLTHEGSSQNKIYPDFGIWSGANLDYELNQKFSLKFAEIFRLKENCTQLNLLYTDIGIQYSFNKNFSQSLIYRSINKYKKEGYFSFRHRIELDTKFKYKFSSFNLSIRERLQGEVRDVYTSQNGHLPEFYSRTKFDLKYDFGKKFVPYASFEARYAIRNPREVDLEETWRSRTYMGLVYKINDISDLDLYYMIQNDIKLVDIAQGDIYIVGLEYSITLGKK